MFTGVCLSKVRLLKSLLRLACSCQIACVKEYRSGCEKVVDGCGHEGLRRSKLRAETGGVETISYCGETPEAERKCRTSQQVKGLS